MMSEYRATCALLTVLELDKASARVRQIARRLRYDSKCTGHQADTQPLLDAMRQHDDLLAEYQRITKEGI
jgi:hypothetical protein